MLPARGSVVAGGLLRRGGRRVTGSRGVPSPLTASQPWPEQAENSQFEFRPGHSLVMRQGALGPAATALSAEGPRGLDHLHQLGTLCPRGSACEAGVATTQGWRRGVACRAPSGFPGARVSLITSTGVLRSRAQAGGSRGTQGAEDVRLPLSP